MLGEGATQAGVGEGSWGALGAKHLGVLESGTEPEPETGTARTDFPALRCLLFCPTLWAKY